MTDPEHVEALINRLRPEMREAVLFLHPEMPDDEVDALVEHMLDTQVRMQEIVRDDPGIDVRFVNTDPNAVGHLWTCTVCGRSAVGPIPVPEGQVVVCPRCVPK